MDQQGLTACSSDENGNVFLWNVASRTTRSSIRTTLNDANSAAETSMHDVLRQPLLRKIESLPDEQIYQVLDFIEFLESKYAEVPPVETSGLQKFAEGLEDKLRRKAVSPSTIREAFQLISAADRVLANVSSAGKQILADLNIGAEGSEAAPPASNEAADTGGPEVADARGAEAADAHDLEGARSDGADGGESGS